MAKKEQVPAIRFQGFADPWEQRKLGDLVQFSKGTGYSKGDLRESGTPIILYGRLYTKYETVISEVDTFADAKAGSVYSRGGEVIVPASGETAEDISIASVVEKSGVLLGGDLNIITPPADLDAPFLAISISNGKPHEDMAKMAQGKSVVHLHNTDLEKIDLTYPSHEEQIQISGYFGALDHLITLHQREESCAASFSASCFGTLKAFFWEQRKLGELYTERNERGDDTLQILSVSIHSGVSDGELDTDGLGKMVRRSEDKSTYKHVYVGDLIFNMMRAWQGAIGTTKSEGMISPAYISAIPSDEVYPPFMSYLLRRKEAINQINNLSYGVTDFRKRLYWDSFVRVSCLLPSVEEQRYITEVLEKIDTLITLHQRKYDKLVAIKRSMLEKMFPREGSRFPEIRFAGFTDPWEQRKWSETVDISTDMVDPRTGQYDELPHVAPGNIESFTGRLYDNVKLVKDENLISGKFRFYAGDIIYGKINPQLGKYVFATFPGLTSADAYVLNAKNGINQMFLFAILQTQDFFDYSVSVSRRSGMPKINRDELNSYSFMAPSVEEQARIGRFLLDLDTLITLHQRKLEKLQAIKRSMLEKMFV